MYECEPNFEGNTITNQPGYPHLRKNSKTVSSQPKLQPKVKTETKVNYFITETSVEMKKYTQLSTKRYLTKQQIV